MSIDSVLQLGRAAAKARMRERVRLYTQGPDVFDRASGQTVPGPQMTLYEGIARVRQIAQATGEERQAGDREVVLREYEVHLPWDAQLQAVGRVLAGARVEVLTSRDVRMAGVVFWVSTVQFADQATAWRLSVEDRS